MNTFISPHKHAVFTSFPPEILHHGYSVIFFKFIVIALLFSSNPRYRSGLLAQKKAPKTGALGCIIRLPVSAARDGAAPVSAVRAWEARVSGVPVWAARA